MSYIFFTNYIANNIFNDSTISFSYAAPTDLAIPRIELDTSVDYFVNFPPEINSSAPLDCPFNIATFTPHESSEIIYRFKSTYPDESIFEDKPIGIKTETKNSLSYLFGFHLYYMQKQDAIELIDYIYNSQSENPQPEQLPSSIQLTQNYPNPFNSSTSIEFALNKSVSVSLSVYNILGQKVTTIIDNQVMAAGNHLYFWDAKNDAGKDVSTGIYLYRLETREQNISKKMVFLK
ncbi:MAG: T9SS C-terminal target domain-containing protein [Calditrichaeota bacterium]|nr:MAG: T9SS C-terminal target domain-containing protein [Calditrichota bacterium]